MDNVNINDILSSLSNDDIEMLKGVAGSILNQSDTQSSAQQQKPPQSTPQSATIKKSRFSALKCLRYNLFSVC